MSTSPDNSTRAASAALATGAPKKLTVRQQLESPAFIAEVSKALPKHLTPERFIRVAITTLTKTPKLADCDQHSLFGALLTCSQLGIEPDGRRAHLIPYGKQCQLIIDYKGMVELALRGGSVSNIHADVVCENDFFETDTGRVSHKVNYRSARGKVYAAYCIVRFKDGGEKAEVMTRDEIEDIRKRSRAGGSGPWVTDWNEMAKKTVARRVFKWVPLSPEIRDVVEAGDDVIDIPGKVERTVARGEPINPFELPPPMDESPSESGSVSTSTSTSTGEVKA